MKTVETTQRIEEIKEELYNLKIACEYLYQDAIDKYYQPKIDELKKELKELGV